MGSLVVICQKSQFAIAAGVSLYELARFMGTSVEQIDRTSGHLLPDTSCPTRPKGRGQALDAFLGADSSLPRQRDNNACRAF
jgi:hypothetical protein